MGFSYYYRNHIFEFSQQVKITDQIQSTHSIGKVEPPGGIGKPLTTEALNCKQCVCVSRACTWAGGPPTKKKKGESVSLTIVSDPLQPHGL